MSGGKLFCAEIEAIMYFPDGITAFFKGVPRALPVKGQEIKVMGVGTGIIGSVAGLDHRVAYGETFRLSRAQVGIRFGVDVNHNEIKPGALVAWKEAVL